MSDTEQILSVPSAPGDLAVGEYVFASRWGDADWCDPWGVGHVSEIGDSWVRLAETGARRFPKAMRISHEVGAAVISEYPALEKASAELDYSRVAKIFGINTPASDAPADLAAAQQEIARLRAALETYEAATAELQASHSAGTPIDWALWNIAHMQARQALK